MDRQTLLLALSNARSLAAQRLYLGCGLDATRPIQTYALTTTRCNARCRMCGFWRESPADELPLEVWLRYLGQLKDFSGAPNVNFSGGEPLVRADIYDMLKHCRDLQIPAGITTNGILVNKANIPKLLDCELFSISVSIDSVDEFTQDSMRGIEGISARVKKNLDELVSAKQACGSRVRIIIKSIVCSETLEGLPQIVDYAHNLGANGVSFQPIFEWSDESREMMSGVDPVALQEIVDRLSVMKREGFPIINSEASMRQWMDYFQGKGPARRSPCVVALRDLFVYPNGDAIVCGTCNTVIGNIAENDIRSIWFSSTARKLRRGLVRCNRLCLQTCVVKRSLRDYVDLLRKLR